MPYIEIVQMGAPFFSSSLFWSLRWNFLISSNRSYSEKHSVSYIGFRSHQKWVPDGYFLYLTQKESIKYIHFKL